MLLLDSGLCIAKPWMLCICYCTNSIKLHRAAFVGFRTVYSQAMDALHLLLYQFHQTPPGCFCWIQVLCIAKPWMLCICYCTKSIKLHRLLLLDSGLCIAKPWMLCICYCTKSIKLHRAAFVGFRTVYSQAMDALHVLPIPSESNHWYTFSLHVDGFWQIRFIDQNAYSACIFTGQHVF